MAVATLLGCDEATAEYLENVMSTVPTDEVAEMVEQFAAPETTPENLARAIAILSGSSLSAGASDAGAPTRLRTAVNPGATSSRDAAAMAVMRDHGVHRMADDNSDVGKVPEDSSVTASSTSAASGRRSRRKAGRKMARKADKASKARAASGSGSGSSEDEGGAEADPEASGDAATTPSEDAAARALTGAGAAEAEAGAYNASTGEVDGEVTLHVDPTEAEIDPLHIFAAAGSAWRGRAPEGARRDLTYHNLNMSSDKEDMLVGATLRFREGRRYGLVGRNGVGKSTLLRHIAARRLPFFPKYLTTVLVQQEARASDASALETVVGVDKRREALLTEEARIMTALDTAADADEAARLAAELGDVSDLLEQTDASAAEARAAAVLVRLGFSDAQMRRPLTELSGGWRMRVSLAMALFLRPDLLLLDEPETHLSMDAVLWLQEFIATIEDMTVVIVSHNRSFLDATVQEVCFFHSANKNLEYWPGNYTNFREARDAWRRKREHMFESQELKRSHMLQSIENIKAQVARAGNNRMNAGQIRSRKLAAGKKLGAYRLENGKKFKFGLYGERSRNEVKLEKPEAPVVLNFHGAPPPGGGGALLGLEGVSFAYPGHKEGSGYLLEDVTVTIEPRARIAVLGSNGAGKSTLLKLLKGELAPLKGTRVARPGVRIAHFAQYHVDMLHLEQSALDFFLANKRTPAGTLPSELDIRTHLAQFGVVGDQPVRPMSTLSGGQRSRVAFATVMWERPHIFLVDEGSHHLDVAVLDALGQALRRFDGAVVLVSHDEYLVRDVCERGFPEAEDGSAMPAGAAAAAASAPTATVGGAIAAAAAGPDSEPVFDNIGCRPELWVVEGGKVGSVDSMDAFLDSIRPSIEALGAAER